MELNFLDRSAQLYEIRQTLTYEGLLNGLPTIEGNQRRIKYILEEKGNQRYDVAPYLIPPIEKRIEHHSDTPYPFGTPSALPSVTCIARFESTQPSEIGEGDGSGLIVIWFQNEFALPIEPSVIAHISGLNWARLAGSYEY